MSKMTYLTNWKPLLVQADLLHPRSLKTVIVNQTTNLSQHATPQANEFAHLPNHRLIVEFLFQNEITPIGGTLMQEKPSAFCVRLAKEMLYTSFVSCTAVGGMQLPTK